MALLQSTTISGSIASTGSLSITGSTMIFPIIESSLTSSFSGSGKMWVNGDNQSLQYSVQTSLGTIQSPASFMGAWSAGGALIIARHAFGGAGTQGAALAFGGRNTANSCTSATEEYNGASWATGGALNQQRAWLNGAGTQNAGLAIAGYVGNAVSCVEEYDGSSWSNGVNVTTARFDAGGAGSQTAALLFGGDTPSETAATEEFNGVTWFNGGNMNNTRTYGFGTGTQNSAIVQRGASGAGASKVEVYNGSTWSETNISNNAIYQRVTNGTTNAAVFSGGNPGFVSGVEEYNGITFVEGCNLLTGMAQGNMSCIGTQDASIVAGGYTPSQISCTQEYNKNNISPYTTCVWTTASALNISRWYVGGAGTQTAALAFGGGNPTASTCTEEYNGTSWNVGGALAIARYQAVGTGTQDAALTAGGTGGNVNTEEYNGTSWSPGGNLQTGRQEAAATGVQNAALMFGGFVNGVLSVNEEYNGTAWTSENNLSTARFGLGGAGTQNAALAFGGGTTPVSSETEEYNGSTWATGGALTIARLRVGGTGTQDAAIAFGGLTPGLVSCAEIYNGTTWAASSPMNIPVSQMGRGVTNQNDAISFGGGTPAVTSGIELFSTFCSSTGFCSSLPVWSGAAYMLAHSGYSAAFGTQNAAAVTTGKNASGATTFGTEEYNGTSWSPGGTNVNQTGEGTGRFAAGTLNAGLLMGGWPTQTWTEEYDGATWTSANAMSQTRHSGGGNGTQTAALVAGGSTVPGRTAATEEYDGTNWSNGGSLSIARYLNLSTGTQNDAVTAGGFNSAYCTSTEEYNGTTWATGDNLPEASGDTTGAMFGVGSYDATYVAGNGPRKTTNIQYNGSAWSFRPPAPLAVNAAGRVGTSNAGLLTGGRTNSGYISSAFKYNNDINTCVSLFTWSVGGSLATAVYDNMGTGTKDAAISVGGFTPSVPTTKRCTQEYNGSTWAVGGTTPGDVGSGAAAGVLSAALVFGGNPGGNSTIEYDGSTWATGGNLIQGRGYLFGGAGTQNAAKAFGGLLGPNRLASTENYDGSSWSATTCMSTARAALGATQKGTQNSVLAFGGYTQPSCAASDCVEAWNGTAWSTQTAIPNGMGFGNGQGSSDIDAIRVGGYVAPASNSYISSCVQQFDGASWSNVSSVLVPMHYNSGAGSSSTSVLSFGKRTPIGAGTFEGTTTTEQRGAGKNKWIGKVNFVTE